MNVEWCTSRRGRMCGSQRGGVSHALSNPCNSCNSFNSLAAFTKLDLIVLAAVVALLAGWLVFAHTGERGRRAVCTRNLMRLGQATHSFASEHGESLPVAMIAQPALTWDMELEPYLQSKPAVAAPSDPGSNSAPVAKKSYYAERQAQRAEKQRVESQTRQAAGRVVWGAASVFYCPSDHFARARPRSYAMPAHKMDWENWPPGPEDRYGVGLAWDRVAMKRLLNLDPASDEAPDLAALAAVKLGSIPDPANTLLLTELIQGNQLKSTSRCTLAGPEEQVEGVANQGGSLHTGRFNYLMVDGHVEWLRPYQLETFSPNAGIWTIRKGD
jgi:prepilin-type processing-associated H-X9-DG protein